MTGEKLEDFRPINKISRQHNLPIFSYVNTALIDYDFFEMQHLRVKIDVSKYYYRQSNE